MAYAVLLLLLLFLNEYLCPKMHTLLMFIFTEIKESLTRYLRQTPYIQKEYTKTTTDERDIQIFLNV